MRDECTYNLLFYVVFEVADWAIMLCGCQGNRWPIWCLMGDEVKMGFYNAGIVLLLVWPIYQPHHFQWCLVWALTLLMVILWWEVLVYNILFRLWRAYLGGYNERMGFLCSWREDICSWGYMWIWVYMLGVFWCVLRRSWVCRIMLLRILGVLGGEQLYWLIVIHWKLQLPQWCLFLFHPVMWISHQYSKIGRVASVRGGGFGLCAML
jgi:hypothetical protein